MSPMNWAQLIGGLFILLYLLVDVFRKLTDHSKWGQARKQEKETRQREAALKQYKEFTAEFVESFVPPLVKKFTEQDEKLFNKMEQLTQSSNDLLRKEMTSIYYKYLPYKKILQYDKECFIKLYHNYIAQGGNSYITDIYNELKDWEVVLTREDLEK